MSFIKNTFYHHPENQQVDNLRLWDVISRTFIRNINRKVITLYPLITRETI